MLKCIKFFFFVNFNRKVYLNLFCFFLFVNVMDVVGLGYVLIFLCFIVVLEYVYLKLYWFLFGVDLVCEESFRKGVLVIKENI